MASLENNLTTKAGAENVSQPTVDSSYGNKKLNYITRNTTAFSKISEDGSDSLD